MDGLSKIIDKLKKINDCKVVENASMKEYTSFKIGGPADIMVEPSSISALQEVLKLASATDISYFILGKGSNLLVGDLGFRGIVIKLTGLDEIQVEDNLIRAQAGTTLAKVAKAALDAELAGLEFASGIPGSLGGAVFMNAGAYGGEMKDVVTKVIALTRDGEKKIVSGEEAQFGYRESIFHKEDWIVVEANMELEKGNPEEIRAKMNDLNGRRKDKQPLDYPSAGSIFKRPPGHYAGALIEGAHLKGVSIGGAQVSPKHAGFIVNTGEATAKDVRDLIRHIQDTVREKDGVDLETEVRFIGEFKQ